MALCVSVANLSGETISLQVDPEHSVAELMRLLETNGEVMAWGSPDAGGDCSAVAAQLVEVCALHSTDGAFAALTRWGKLLTWGCAWHGGDSREVSEDLELCCQVVATRGAFAVRRTSGEVVVWGDPSTGGDVRATGERLVRVRKLFANAGALAALREDGSIVTWGSHENGGDSRQVQSQLVDVLEIHCAQKAFAAVRSDGRIVTWGALSGPVKQAPEIQLQNIREVVGSNAGFAAILQDGSMVTWGQQDECDCSHLLEELSTSTVRELYATSGAFCVLLAHGGLRCFGRSDLGGEGALEEVVQVAATLGAFAALRSNGSVTAWGHRLMGGEGGQPHQAHQVLWVFKLRNRFLSRLRSFLLGIVPELQNHDTLTDASGSRPGFRTEDSVGVEDECENVVQLWKKMVEDERHFALMLDVGLCLMTLVALGSISFIVGGWVKPRAPGYWTHRREASAAEVASAYGELPSEAQKSLQEALKLLKAKTSGTLTCRSKLSGEVMATLDSSQTWTYKEMAAALREKLPETKTQVIKALSDMGFANGSGEVQCAISQFDFGTKMTLEEAQPILEDITEKLNGLSKAMIMEIKALKSPPHGIILDFMEQLVTFNKDEVPMESLVELQWPWSPFRDHYYSEVDVTEELRDIVQQLFDLCTQSEPGGKVERGR
eukprot:g30793.t1